MFTAFKKINHISHETLFTTNKFKDRMKSKSYTVRQGNVAIG